jgi:phosphohistidine phosphatase
MNLYVLRHGIATGSFLPGSSLDSERALTPKGRRKLRKIAEGMRASGMSFDLILSSPYTRARETAEIVAAVFKRRGSLELLEALAPSGSMRRLIEFIDSFEGPKDDILLVGHEPFLSEFISFLICGNASALIEMKKGGFAKVKVERLHHGRCGVLESLLTPKQTLRLR